AEDLGINPAELAHLEEPLFGTLWDSAPNEIKVMLNEQYRMRPPIMAAINQFYNGELRGGENVPEHGLSFENVGPDTSIVWIETPNTKPFYEKGDMSKYNDEEIKIIKRLLAQMNASWVNSGAERKKQVGIITFYRSQLSRIREEIRPEDYPALVLRRGTVDQFQGMEQEVVIVSLVRNNGDHHIGFAKKPERIDRKST